jgi:NTE family protein
MSAFQEADAKWMFGATDKLGLALSGGGFRASLFHIGVLARMAELDLLRHVQVISTVSGGSIVGAYYYLKIKQLLEGRRLENGAPVQPSRQVYVDIVKEIEVDFLAAVQTNIRTRALLDPVKNGKMVFSDDYSRSDRMAELYHEHFYAPLWEKEGGASAEPIRLKDLEISPARRPPGFDIPAEFKIPILTLNATCLNTGHAWRFTASHVGEPPRRPPTVDTNVILGYLRFDGQGAPPVSPEQAERRREKLDDLRLADAVAASAAVPGIFAPFAIHDLYWNSRGEELVVELVDGGVFDNQGVDALFEENCTHIVCSDASGQLEDLRAPASRTLPVLARSNSVLMERVRDEIYRELNKNGLKDFAFFHLRQTAPQSDAYPPIPGPADRSDPEKKDGHVYRLSNLRTDLDSFTNIEAHALMYHGYLLSDDLAAPAGRLGSARAEDWRFLDIRSLVTNDPDRLLKHLVVGKDRFFKIFRLGDGVAWSIAIVLGLAGLVLAVEVIATPWSRAIVTAALWTAALIGAVVWIARRLEDTERVKYVLDRVRPRRRGDPWYLTYLPAALFGWIGSLAANIHLRIFDPRFLKAGKIATPPLPPASSSSQSNGSESVG